MNINNIGNLEIVKELIEQSFDVDMKDPFSRTALHYAANKGDCTIFILIY